MLKQILIAIICMVVAGFISPAFSQETMTTVTTETTIAKPAEAIKDPKPDEGKSFHLAPPDYSIKPSVRHAERRKQKALRWYVEQLGHNKLK